MAVRWRLTPPPLNKFHYYPWRNFDPYYNKKKKRINKRACRAVNIKKYKKRKDVCEETGISVITDYRYATCAWIDNDPDLLPEKSWKDLTKNRNQYDHNLD